MSALLEGRQILQNFEANDAVIWLLEEDIRRVAHTLTFY